MYSSFDDYYDDIRNKCCLFCELVEAVSEQLYLVCCFCFCSIFLRKLSFVMEILM